MKSLTTDFTDVTDEKMVDANRLEFLEILSVSIRAISGQTLFDIWPQYLS